MDDRKSQNFWKQRVQQYLDSDWSHAGSPFAHDTLSFLSSKSKILELGCGAGQDGIWFAGKGHNLVLSDVVDSGFSEINRRIAEYNLVNNAQTMVIDVSKPFMYELNSFDCVYAQLSLHYFDDATTNKIFSEIYRILKPGGIVAVMMNTVKDKEYKPELADKEGFIIHKDIKKRYFTVGSLSKFVNKFKTLVLDDKGRTPKDDLKSNSGMIRFIGQKL